MINKLRNLFNCCLAKEEEPNDYTTFFEVKSDNTNIKKENIVTCIKNSKNSLNDIDCNLNIKFKDNNNSVREQVKSETTKKNISLTMLKAKQTKDKYLAYKSNNTLSATSVKASNKQISFNKNIITENNKVKTKEESKHHLTKVSTITHQVQFANKSENIPVISKVDEQRIIKNKNTNEIDNPEVIEKSDTVVKNPIDNVSKVKNKLQLFEVEGNSLLGKKLEITPNGLINSLRNVKDCKTYFGIRSKSNKGATELDYVLNLHSNNNETYVIFCIYFNKQDNKYFLTSKVNEVDRNVLFVRLEKEFPIFRKHIVSLGDIHISIEVDTFQSLKIEIVSGNEETKSKLFTKTHVGLVKIGRSKENDIVLSRNSFSRVQASFYFNETSNNWILQDGTGNMKSKNGTWIYLDDIWEIEDVLYFRIAENFLCINKV
jgi:hypothetical protein